MDYKKRRAICFMLLIVLNDCLAFENGLTPSKTRNNRSRNLDKKTSTSSSTKHSASMSTASTIKGTAMGSRAMAAETVTVGTDQFNFVSSNLSTAGYANSQDEIYDDSSAWPGNGIDAFPSESDRLGSDILNYLTMSLDGAIGEFGNFSNLTCDELSGADLHSHIKEMPIIGELYDLVSAVLLILGGCTEEAAERIRELETSSVDTESIVEMTSLIVESMRVTPINGSSREMADDLLNQTKTDDLLESIAVTAAEINVLQAIANDEPSGILKSRWQLKSESDADFSLQENATNYCHGSIGNRGALTTLISGKLACEKLGPRCIGVREDLNSSSSIHLILNLARGNAGNNCMLLSDELEELDVSYWIRSSNSVVDNSPRLDTKIMTRRRRRRDSTHGDSDDAELRTPALLYEHGGFNGRQKRVSGTVNDVGTEWSGVISSIACPEECTVIVFDEPEFQGRQLAFVNGTSFVGNKFNDRIASLVVLPISLPAMCYTVYEREFHSGRHERFCGDQNLAESSWKGRVQSMQLECEECSVLVYDVPNFEGRFRAFSTRHISSTGVEWRNKVASIQIRPWVYESDHEGELERSALLYTGYDYSGASMFVSGSSQYIGNVKNDKVSSISCEDPCSLVVFEDANFSGDSRLYRGSQYRMHDFDDKLSSVLVLSNELCVTFYEHFELQGSSVRYCQDVNYVGLSWNDRFSSLRVECDQCSVIIYEHGNYRGRYKSFIGTVRSFPRQWNDMTSSIQLKPWYTNEQNCAVDGERKAYDVIQWIPLLSILYSLTTSIYYGAVGCNEVAKERAIDMALDLGMDAAVALTGGAASGVALGIKTGIKAGAKAGVKVVAKWSAAVIRNSARASISAGRKLLSRNIISGTKNLVKKNLQQVGRTVVNLPRVVQSGVKAARDEAIRISRDGLRKTAQRAASGTETAFKQFGDDLVERARKQIDIDAGYKNSGRTAIGDTPPKIDDGNARRGIDEVLCRRRRMPGSSSCKPNDSRLSRQRIEEAANRALSEPRIQKAKTLFDDINNSPDIDFIEEKQRIVNNLPQQVQEPFLAKELVVSNDKPVQEVMENLQFYCHFMQTAQTADGLLPKHLIVNMPIGGGNIRFALKQARENQILVMFNLNGNKKTFDGVLNSYDRIAGILDSGPGIPERAEQIIYAIEDTAGRRRSADWTTLGSSFNIEQQDAARQLIVLTHIAESASPWKSHDDFVKFVTNRKLNNQKKAPPGGVPGMGKLARRYINDIKDGKPITFTDIFKTGTKEKKGRDGGKFIIARQEGKNQIKSWLYSGNNDGQFKELVDTISRISDDSNKRR